MVDIEQLSRVGFGAYRVSKSSAAHERSLLHALERGCNLIDTSSNYADGQSEELIGKVTAEHPEFDAFVVTKAGYVDGANIEVLADLNSRGLAVDDMVAFQDGSNYSIHPEFLRTQLDLAHHRLRKRPIDCFMLHNPERCFRGDTPMSSADYYRSIGRAFEFLEEAVASGMIRYYGVSSNTLASAPDEPGANDLHELLKAAEDVSESHHFKLIEFPFNLFETDALQPHHQGLSLLELAGAKGLVTLGNRPLNANTADGPVRLAAYPDLVADFDRDDEAKVFEDCVGRIERQLRRVGADQDPMDFMVMQFLRDARLEMNDPERVTRIFGERFQPFLESLYGAELPADDLVAYQRLQRNALLASLVVVTERANDLRQHWTADGTIAADDCRPLATIVCEKYLAAGLDHVLVGMRRVAYVDSLTELF